MSPPTKLSSPGACRCGLQATAPSQRPLAAMCGAACLVHISGAVQLLRCLLLLPSSALCLAPPTPRQFGVGAVICAVVTLYRWLYLEESEVGGLRCRRWCGDSWGAEQRRRSGHRRGGCSCTGLLRQACSSAGRVPTRHWHAGVEGGARGRPERAGGGARCRGGALGRLGRLRRRQNMTAARCCWLLLAPPRSRAAAARLPPLAPRRRWRASGRGGSTGSC